MVYIHEFVYYKMWCYEKQRKSMMIINFGSAAPALCHVFSGNKFFSGGSGPNGSVGCVT